MTIIQWQDVTTSFTPDPQCLLIYWGPFQAGDEGLPISVYAYPFVSWHFTGYPQGGNNSNPNVPIIADRKITILGSNDSVCYGPIFSLNADATGMNSRLGDPMRSGYPDNQYLHIKPVVSGTANPIGPDCGILLFCSKVFGPRT